MKRIALACICSLICVTAVAETASTVTIPIKDYMELRKLSEKGSLTTLEDTRIWGEWKKKLQISFAGASTGKAEPIAVLAQAQGLSLTGCSGAALLRVGDGTIDLLPQAARFKVTCEITVKNWENLTVTILNSLFLKTDVRGVDPVIALDTVAQRQISFHRAEIIRSLASEPLNEDPSFQARYQISVTPEETKFQYIFSAHNPNRSPKTFDLKWPNGEVVSRIETANTYESKEKGVQFKLVPGESRIRITGRFPGKAFKPLLNGKGLEYLLVDNHPLLTLDFKGGSRRISIHDTGMAPSYAGGRAFLVAKGDEFEWESKQLEVFSAMTYTVTGANYRYYASTQGAPVVEASFNIDNQGSPEIPLKIPGQATYLEINGNPQVLTKDKDDQLLLRLPSGTGQHVFVQYKTNSDSARSLASVSEELARPSSLMSNVGLYLQLPGKRSMVYASGLDDFHTWMNWGAARDMILVLCVVGLLLRRMGWPVRHWIPAAVIAALLTYEYAFLVKWSFFIAIGVIMFRHRQRIFSAKPTSWKGWVGGATVCLIGLFCLAVAVRLISDMDFSRASFVENNKLSEMREAMAAAPARDKSYSFAYSNSVAQAGAGGAQYHRRMAASVAGRGTGLLGALKKTETYDAAEAVPPPPPPPAPETASVELEQVQAQGSLEGMADDSAAPMEAPAVSDGNSYQGLPAKIVIPNDGSALYFNAGLLDNAGAVHLRFVTVADWIVRTFYSLLFAMLVWSCWSERARVRAYLHLR